MGKRGLAAEEFVAWLERSLASTAETQHHARLMDVHTGRMREVDVLVTINDGYRKSRWVYEVKDRARPVDTPVVEQMAQLRDSLGVDRVLLVSTSGFTSEARTKARNLSIPLLGLKNTSSPTFGVSIAPGATMTWVRAENRLCQFLVDEARLQIDPKQLALPVQISGHFEHEGKKLELKQFVDECVNDVSLDIARHMDTDGPIELAFSRPTPGGKLVIAGLHYEIPILALTFSAQVYLNREPMNPQTFVYLIEGEGKELANLIRIPFGTQDLHFTVVPTAAGSQMRMWTSKRK